MEEIEKQERTYLCVNPYHEFEWALTNADKSYGMLCIVSKYIM